MTHRRTQRRDGDDLTALRDLALLDAGYETGFWDDNGRPAPWPEDIDERRPAAHDPISLKPGEPPF
jgi:hypothetical protein